MGKLVESDPPNPVFDGIAIRDIDELNLEVVNSAVWVFLKRRDGSIVRIWISNPDRTASEPLRVTVEAENA